MKKNIEFLIMQSGILLLMILFLDFSFFSKTLLWFVWCSWTIVVSMMYAIVWRESVDCRCLEKETEE